MFQHDFIFSVFIYRIFCKYLCPLGALYSLFNKYSFFNIQIDTDNFEWFQKDTSKATLLGIQLISGSLRSLNTFGIDFQYPISVIAGKMAFTLIFLYTDSICPG